MSFVMDGTSVNGRLSMIYNLTRSFTIYFQKFLEILHIRQGVFLKKRNHLSISHAKKLRFLCKFYQNELTLFNETNDTSIKDLFTKIKKKRWYMITLSRTFLIRKETNRLVIKWNEKCSNMKNDVDPRNFFIIKIKTMKEFNQKGRNWYFQNLF